MKTFINKTTEITKQVKEGSDEKINLGYANLAIVGLNTPPQGGWTPAEMTPRIKVIAKLDDTALDASIELEDAELDLIVTCSNVKWQFMHKDIVTFVEYLEELKKE